MTVEFENASAIVRLYQDVRAYFETKGRGSSVVFGRKERWIQINQGTGGANRVVFIPGRLKGEDGALIGVDGPGEIVKAGVVTPRALFLQSKIVTISIWAANETNDPSASVDEVSQQQEIEQMFEWVIRGVRRSPAGAANAEWGALAYNSAPNEIRFGTEYLAELEVGTQYFDDAPGIVTIESIAVNRGALT